MQFIFVHGWGMDHTIWDALTPHFSDTECTHLNLGFIGDNITTDIPNSQTPRVFITHSLGTMWSLKHHADTMDALIAINGFTNFDHYSDSRTLKIMQRNLKRTSSRQVQSFWGNCNLPEKMQNTLDPNINTDRLHTGLDWLMQWDETAQVKEKSVPTLVLGGQQDKITPCAQMQKEWHAHTLKIQPEAGHALPLSHPQWCASEIKEFLHEHSLEK